MKDSAIKVHQVDKTVLLSMIELMDEHQISFLMELIHYANNPYELRERFFPLCGITKEESNKIDTAYPINYGRSIYELYPDFKNGMNVYDYNEALLGSMVNLNNRFKNHVLKTLKINF